MMPAAQSNATQRLRKIRVENMAPVLTGAVLRVHFGMRLTPPSLTTRRRAAYAPADNPGELAMKKLYPDAKAALDGVLFDGMIVCAGGFRSEEHTSELQSLLRSSYAVFCLK